MKKVIPHIDQLQRAACEVRAARDVPAITNGLKYFLRHYDVLNYKLLYEFPLWRARRCNDERGFARTFEMYYPPARFAKVGRLNEAESPVLYTSFNVFTTLKELNVAPGEYVQVVGYSMHSTRPVRCLILGEYLNVHRRGQGFVPGGCSNEINKILTGMPHEVGLSFVFMDAFLSELLTDPDSNQREHVHSRVLAKLLFDKYPYIEAIHYPSVASEGSMNLAIKPGIADEALGVMGTSVLHIDTLYDFGIFRFTVTRNARGIDPNGIINWEDVIYRPPR